VRLSLLALILFVLAVAALFVNFVGAAGGHCDDSCSANFPYWLYVGSAWTVMLSVAALLVIGAVGLWRWSRRS
jgi:hypothetical protein